MFWQNSCTTTTRYNLPFLSTWPSHAGCTSCCTSSSCEGFPPEARTGQSLPRYISQWQINTGIHPLQIFVVLWLTADPVKPMRSRLLKCLRASVGVSKFADLHVMSLSVFVGCMFTSRLIALVCSADQRSFGCWEALLCTGWLELMWPVCQHLVWRLNQESWEQL